MIKAGWKRLYDGDSRLIAHLGGFLLTFRPSQESARKRHIMTLSVGIDMNVAASYKQVFDLVLAGEKECEVLRRFEVLSDDERQTLLCTLCSMRQEIAATCHDSASTVSRLLSLCRQCVDERHTCRFGRGIS